MVRTATAVLGVTGGLVAVAGAWTLYQRHTTDEVPYAVVGRLGDVELRRYPSTVVVETVAPTETEAFRRLFRYISGANRDERAIEMTTPVEMSPRGTPIRMTAPVEVGPRREPSPTDPTAARDDDDGVRMAFSLPPEYDADSAPAPTDSALELVVVPERTLAVRRFSWFPTERRIASEADRLLAALAAADVSVSTEPFFLGYDAPWALPFLRRNEVAVDVTPTD